MERALGPAQLSIREPRCRRPNANSGLELHNFECLALSLRLGASREILADALAVRMTGNAETTFPEGLVNSEMTNEVA